jgi:TatA/E family protein of Tat protein translocase
MGNLGMPELIMIAVLALLLFGPKKLPEIGKSVGRALGEFKRASNDLKRTIEDEIEKSQEPARTTGPGVDPGPTPRTPSNTVAADAAASVPAPPESGSPSTPS